MNTTRRRPLRSCAFVAAALLAGLAFTSGCSLPASSTTANIPPSPPPAEARSVATPADGYRGIWYSLGSRGAGDVKYSGGLGTYTSSHTPMAVYAPAVDRTFFTYGGTPAPDRRQLQIMVGVFDHARRRLARPVLLLDKPEVDDPHDNASLNLDDAGHLWVFASGRNTARPGVIFRSQRPFDISQFDRIATQAFTYPQPWHTPGRGWLLLFTQYTAGRELYWKTSPDGFTWSADHKLAGFGGHYQTSAHHAPTGTIATFFNYHPGGDVDRRTNLYYAQTTDHGATWTTVDRRPLTLPLATIDNPALVADLESAGELLFTCDLNFDAHGRPILLYVIGRDARPGPATAPREWRVSHWTGSAWETHTVTTSDHNYDMGSLYVENDAWRIVAPTAPGPQPHGVGGEMVLWISRDQGRTWTAPQALTQASRHNHSYARRPLHARDPFYVFWADGDPRHLSPSQLYFADSTGREVHPMPSTIATDDIPVPASR